MYPNAEIGNQVINLCCRLDLIKKSLLDLISSNFQGCHSIPLILLVRVLLFQTPCSNYITYMIISVVVLSLDR